MKIIKYRHLITNDYVEKINDHYYILQYDGRIIPSRLIERSNDWVIVKYENKINKGYEITE